MPIENRGFARDGPDGKFHDWSYHVRDLRDHDVKIEVLFCGICHSDIHMAKNEWGNTTFPVVPGHEFTGTVVEVGPKAKKYKVGDTVGVGCLVGSCGDCRECKRHLENYCLKAIPTYSGVMPDGEITYGGYGKFVVANEDFVLRIPSNLPPDKAAPLLCAGITTFSPCMHNGLNRGGFKVGVIGLGGLGHMAVQFAAKMGNEVTIITRSTDKVDIARKLGATKVILSTDAKAMKENTRTLDYIIDTVAGNKPMDDYLNLLNVDGILITIGLPPMEHTLKTMPFTLCTSRRSVQGSCIGGIQETQEMLDFCSQHNVTPWIEVIKGDSLDTAYDRVCRSDVRFRFVIDARASHK